MKQLTAKQLTQIALLLAICIASQFMKGVSVYFTGSIVNATLILAALEVGLSSSILLAIISPITAFWIAPSPITMGIPFIVPCIMIGNILLVVTISLCQKRQIVRTKKYQFILGVGIGATLKALWMGCTIVLVLLPLYNNQINVPAEKLNVLLQAAKVTFSLVQWITALIGGVISYIIWLRLSQVKKVN